MEADRYFSSNEAWRGFVSFRSPWNDERLVVLALGSNDEQLSRLHADLSSARINAGIRGDVAIITNETGVRSFRVGEQFPSGEMPVHMMVIWYANQHSALLAILGLLFGALVGGVLYIVLKNASVNVLIRRATSEKGYHHERKNRPSVIHILPLRRTDPQHSGAGACRSE